MSVCPAQSAPKGVGMFPSSWSKPLRRRHGLELFCGDGHTTGALPEAGLLVAAPLDIRNGSHHDLCNGRVQWVVLQWLEEGLIGFVWLGTPFTLGVSHVGAVTMPQCSSAESVQPSL